MLPTLERLVIPHDLWQQITAHVQRCLPEEGCGLLGGALSADGVGQAQRILPVVNMLHSPVRFQMEPSAQLEALQTLEDSGLELLAIFHSHPAGPEHPSVTDRAEFGYPGVLTLILFLPAAAAAAAAAAPNSSGRDWQARAYKIDSSYNPDAAVREIPLAVEIPL